MKNAKFLYKNWLLIQKKSEKTSAPAIMRQEGGLTWKIVRDYLTESGWDKEPPAPELPEEVVQKTREKYLEILEILTK